MNQDQLAEKAGISSVKMIETGSRVGRIGTLRAIATALNVGLGDILETSGPQRPAALTDFLTSALASTITDKEVKALSEMKPPGCEPTVETYHLLLLALRSCKR